MQNNLFLCILDLGMGKLTKPDYFFLEISKFLNQKSYRFIDLLVQNFSVKLQERGKDCSNP